jgi:hypothetical protein
MYDSDPQHRQERLERMVFACLPADVDGRTCRAFARKVARELNATIAARVAEFSDKHPPQRTS